LPWKFNLIAPRQGLFASLLIVSFALHTFLLVIATTHQLNENRASQGQLMTSQLVADEFQKPAKAKFLLVMPFKMKRKSDLLKLR